MVHKRGKRQVAYGDVSLLRSFQLGATPLSGSFLCPFKTHVNRETGKLMVEIPAFNSDRGVVGSNAATHFQLHAMGVEMDFVKKSHSVDLRSTEFYSCSNTEVPSMVLETSLKPKSTKHLFLVFGIEFFMETNGRMYELNSRTKNSFEVVEAVKP